MALPGLGTVALPGLGPVSIVGSVIPRQIARRLARGHDVVGGDAVLRVRECHVVDRGPCGLEGGERLLDTVRHLRVEAWPKVLRDSADPETGERLLEHRRVLRHLIGERCGVARVVARDRLHDQRRIGRGSGHRADLIETRCEGHEATSADPAVGGLQAGDPAESGRLADRAAGI